MASRRTGAYGKLLANYSEDDAVIEAGEKAELLFVRGIAFNSDSDQDGFITDAQVVRVVGAGFRDAAARAETLAKVGLWIREDGGYLVRSHTKINGTAAERGRRLRADRERKRLRAESERNPDTIPSGIRAESTAESNGFPVYIQSSAVQEEHTAEHRKRRPAPPETPDRFDEFWSVYPRRIAKKAAIDHWIALVNRGVDPGDVIAGAKRYADQCRNVPSEYVKQAPGWLKDGRWEDEPPPAAQQKPDGWEYGMDQ